MRYSSNNGSAIGGSFAEAAVHAINEAVERDAVSLFLLHTFAAPTPLPPRFFDDATLPSDLRQLHDEVQARIGRPMWLIDLTTDLDIPTTLAYVAGPRGGFLRGYGTSLSRHYSVYRALTEVLEIALTDDKAGARREAVELLVDHPILQACAAFELDVPTTSSPRMTFVDTAAPRSPTAHLEHLLAALDHRGFAVYTNTLRIFANGITVVHIHIPSLEHFHLIVDGPAAVVPGRRGISALRSVA